LRGQRQRSTVRWGLSSNGARSGVQGNLVGTKIEQKSCLAAAHPRWSGGVLKRLPEVWMVQLRYAGLGDATAAFAALAPLRERLIGMQGTVRPFGPDYLILSAVVKALDTAAYHFTREPDFFALKPDRSKTGATPSDRA